MNARPTPASRRRFLSSAGAVVLGATVAGCTSGTDTSSTTSVTAADSAIPTAGGASATSATPTASTTAAAVQPVPATGVHQAGVVTPTLPQPNLLLAVFTITSPPVPLLAELGRTVLTLTSGEHPRMVGIDPGDLTVTVGVGPRVVTAAAQGIPGSAELPAFEREKIPTGARGGDLLLQVCATDPLLVGLAMAALTEAAGSAVVERWRQRAARGPYQPITTGAAAPRNVLGFVDGIVGPRTAAEFDADIWLKAPAAVAGGTIAVVRRMEIDTASFAAKSVADQEAVIGRTRADSKPLSGGGINDPINLGAKTPDGRYLVPVAAHARRAHALAAGVSLMLRRSYSTDDPAPGLVFISFQNALRTFTATLARMQEMDALLDLTTTTAAATFLILPGFDEQHALGSTLAGI